MASILRRPQSVARSRWILSSHKALPRRPPLPLLYGMQSRLYSSPPEKPGKRPLDYLYKSRSPLSSSHDVRREQKLTAEEAKAIDDFFAFAQSGMPQSMASEVEKVKEYIKREGVSDELRELIRETKSGPLTPAQVAKLWRLTTQVTRQLAEQQARARAKLQDGQRQQHDQKSRQENQKKDDGQTPKFYDIKLDMGNILMSAVVTYMLYRLVVPGENSKEITFQEFRNTFLDKGLVEKLVVINGNRVQAHLYRDSVANMYPESPAAQPGFYYTFTIGSVEAFERRMEQAQNELGIPSSERIPISYAEEGTWFKTMLAFGPTLLFIGAIMYLSRRATGAAGGGQGGIFGMGRSRAKKFNHETDIKVKFSDVAGADEAKREIMEFVSFLKDPATYQKLGAKIPRGAILSGPPGTGKTLLAKATAGEAGVPFFSVSGSEFVEMFVGVGPSRVRDLFSNARKSAPCIIFIDEIDAIGKSRSKQSFGGGNDERESTLNQILTEMDGFNTAEQVVVLAGTNRADVLDKALMRPGRFDRHIAIDPPTLEGRKQIFGVHLKKVVTHEDMEHLKGRLASLTPGFSGADIANVVNEAALCAARNHSSSVKMTHFEQAIERVIGGLENKSYVLSPEDKKTVAYHEAGHAICGWYFQYADPLLKVSIIPRTKGALGYAQYLPGGGSDPALMSINQLMDRMAMTLGGRVSEEMFFDTVTSGASDDFNKVTRLATAMVTKWGMSEKIGYIYYPDAGETPEMQVQKPFSELTAQAIDAEVRRIVTEARTRCRDLLEEKRKELVIIAEELLKKEEITRDDLVRLLGPRPWPDKEEFSKYFSGSPGPIGGSHGPTVPGPNEPGPAGPEKRGGNLPPQLGGSGGEAAPTV